MMSRMQFERGVRVVRPGVVIHVKGYKWLWQEDLTALIPTNDTRLAGTLMVGQRVRVWRNVNPYRRYIAPVWQGNQIVEPGYYIEDYARTTAFRLTDTFDPVHDGHYHGRFVREDMCLTEGL